MIFYAGPWAMCHLMPIRQHSDLQSPSTARRATQSREPFWQLNRKVWHSSAGSLAFWLVMAMGDTCMESASRRDRCRSPHSRNTGTESVTRDAGDTPRAQMGKTASPSSSSRTSSVKRGCVWPGLQRSVWFRTSEQRGPMHRSVRLRFVTCFFLVSTVVQFIPVRQLLASLLVFRGRCSVALRRSSPFLPLWPCSLAAPTHGAWASLRAADGLGDMARCTTRLHRRSSCHHQRFDRSTRCVTLSFFLASDASWWSWRSVKQKS